MAQVAFALPVEQSSFFSQAQVELIKNIYFKELSPDELSVFLHVCKRTGLDPLLKQVHAIKRRNRQADGSYKQVMTIQTGIDGYRLIAERTGKYAPGREPTFTYGEDGRLISATAYIKKLTPDGTWHEIPATAFYEEYCQRDSQGNPTRFWKEMRHGQLAKCAEALAIRKGFPGDLSGIYTREEMQQSEPAIEEPPVEKEETIALELPPDVSQERVNKFVEEISAQTKKTENEVRKNAAQRMEPFLDSFKKWEIKKYSTVEKTA